MKVILLKDVPRLGRRGEVKEVAPGFGRSVLIPAGQATLATPAALKQVKERLAGEAGSAQMEEALAEQASETLAGATITLRGRAPKSEAGKETHLFAALHAEDVVAAIKREKNLILKPEAIILTGSLKTTGFHQAKARLGKRAVDFTILIIGEDK